MDKCIIKKIVFITETSFYERDYKRFGIDVLRSNGFEVEVWNCTPFLYPGVVEDVKGADIVYYEHYFEFQKMQDALEKIYKLTQDVLVVCLIQYRVNSYSLFRAISKKQIMYCVISSVLPFSIKKNGSIMEAILNILRKTRDIEALKQSLFCRVPHKILGINPASFVLIGGAYRANDRRDMVGSQTELLFIHALDYDIYLEEIKNTVEIDNKMGVFIDEYVPFHPHYPMMKVPPFSTPEEYYPPIRRFFDHLEDANRTNITIAAYPRSRYEDHPDYFGGRHVVKGKTMELIRRASFVIGHCSTSINYAVLEKKPVIFITTDSLQRSLQGEWIRQMASFLGKGVINVDEMLEIDFKKEMTIDEKAYRAYKNAFIKKDNTEELPFWQIFSNRIKNLALTKRQYENVN